MKIPISIGAKKLLIAPYTTATEKELLLLSSFEVTDFDRVLELMDITFIEPNDISCEDLTQNEKKVLLYKLREISLGDEVNVFYNCEHCKSPNETVLDASNFVEDCKRNDPDIKKLAYSVTDENLNDFLINEIDIDELDIDEFDQLKERVKQNQYTFNFRKSVNCFNCKGPREFDLDDPEYIIKIMSDDELMGLYKSYNFMVFFGKYTKEDVDKMLPFERTILIGLLMKTKEDLSQ